MKKIAILLENYFDEQEVVYPYHRLREEFEVVLVGTDAEKTYHGKSTFEMKSDVASKDVNVDDYDGLFIPGGFSPDQMRKSQATKDLVRAFDEKKKPIAAICHGPWMLASAADIKGKKIAAVFNIQDDIEHAGAIWTDEELVVDGHFYTGRTPKDLPKLVPAFAKAVKGE